MKNIYDISKIQMIVITVGGFWYLFSGKFAILALSLVIAYFIGWHARQPKTKKYDDPLKKELPGEGIEISEK